MFNSRPLVLPKDLLMNHPFVTAGQQQGDAARRAARPTARAIWQYASLCFLTLLSCCALSVGTGCHAAPVAFRPDQLDTDSKRRLFAADYWRRFGLPTDLRLESTRAVVSEFIVEFVTEKRESGGMISKRQSVVNVPTSLVGAGLEASGINRKVIEYGPSLPQSLPDEMYDVFVTVLRERGCVVIAPEAVISSKTYEQIASRDTDGTPFLQRLNPIASDTGRVMKAVFRPAKGLKVLAADDLAAVERAEMVLVTELEADISIRARFRLGVFDGRASFDRGSIVLITGPRLAGSLASTRSLLSEEEVVAAREFIPVKGGVSKVDAQRYRATVLELFPLFVSMGLDKPLGDDLPRE